MATTKATTLAHTLGGISSDISTAEINRLDGVTGDLQTQLDAKAPLASPDFTGTVDLTGTTLSLDNDQISGDKVSGGTIGAGTFNGTIGTSATINAGTNVSGIGQLVGVSWSNSFNTTGTIVTLENSKSYHVFHWAFRYSSTFSGDYNEYYRITVNSSGVVSGTGASNEKISITSNMSISSPTNNQIKVHTNEGSSSEYGQMMALVFEEGSTMDYS